MKKFLEIFLPIAVGAGIAFYVLPYYGGNLELFVEKMALDWDLPIVGIRIILAVALALVLCLFFNLFARITIWLAVIFILLALFAPALLSGVPLISEDAKTVIEKEWQEMVDKSGVHN